MAGGEGGGGRDGRLQCARCTCSCMPVEGLCMRMESMGRDTSGIIWFAREHTHMSANARSGVMPALARMEAKAWQREKGAEAAALAATEAAVAGRGEGLGSDGACMVQRVSGFNYPHASDCQTRVLCSCRCSKRMNSAACRRVT